MSSDEQQISSEDEPTSSAQVQRRRRRTQTARACERCRAKKTRCDGRPGGQACSQCLATDATCVFSDKRKKRRDPAIVENLELRLERLQLLLERLHPGENFRAELEGDGHAKPSDTFDLTIGSPRGPGGGYDDEPYFAGRWPSDLAGIFKAKGVAANPISHYYGGSSSAQFFTTAVNARSELEGTDRNVVNQIIYSTRIRPEIWNAHPWERYRFSAASQQTQFTFPNPELLRHLVDNYFEEYHYICPMLHRPSFEASLAAGEHLIDNAFGTIVLLVCANSSRLSNDPRVLLDHPEKPGHRHSAGWAWFSQVQLIRNVALAAPSLYDLQAIVLSVIYVSGITPSQSAWTLIGTGIRMSMDMGIHRRHQVAASKLEGELCKRAFWVLVMLDVTNSSFLGRPTALALDNFDVDFPTAVDDPTGEPSHSAYFGCLLNLFMIHSHALQTIYSPNKDRLVAKLGKVEWERRVVLQLDSALNQWSDSIPDHLKWDETATDRHVLVQSSVIGLFYHHARITVHRPFVASKHNKSISSLPSLTICTSAARSIVHLLQAQRRFLPEHILMVAVIPAFMAAMMILLRVWVAKRAGMRVDTLNDMKDLSYIIQFMDEAETTWPLAGRLKDMVLGLATVRDVQLSITNPAKRSRDDDEAQAQGSSALLTSPAQVDGMHASTMPDSMSLFGAPLAQPPDGFYPFDSVPPGPFAQQGSSSVFPPYTSPQEYDPHDFYRLLLSQLDSGSSPQPPYPPPPSNMTAEASQPAHLAAAQERYMSDNHPSYDEFFSGSIDPPQPQPTHIDDSWLLSLLNSSSTQGASASASDAWSSLPPSLEPEEWMQYMTSMTNLPE